MKECECHGEPYSWGCNIECLFSKWGNSDGDGPCWFYDAGHEKRLDWHAFLWAAIHKWVLPFLDRKVTVCFIWTCHNPVRAETVDGKDVTDCWFGKADPPPIVPNWIAVPPEAVKALIVDLEARACPKCRHVEMHDDMDHPEMRAEEATR